MENHQSDPFLTLPSHSQTPSLPPMTWSFPSHMFESFIEASTPTVGDVAPPPPLQQHEWDPQQPHQLQQFHPDLEQQIHHFRRRHGEFYFKQKLRYEGQQKRIEESIQDQVQRYREQQHRQHLEYLQTQQYIREQQTQLCQDLEAHCLNEFENWQCLESEWYDELDASVIEPVTQEVSQQVAREEESSSPHQEEQELDFRTGGKTRSKFPVDMATKLRVADRPVLLHLAGVTTDCSSDDVSMASLQQHRKDLSMDSGIQGSSCDLADSSDTDNSGGDRSPAPHAHEYEAVKKGALSAGYDGNILHGETFNLVEEVLVEEDPRNRFQKEEENKEAQQSLFRATPRMVLPVTAVQRSFSSASQSQQNKVNSFPPKKHLRKKATSLAEASSSTVSLDSPQPSFNITQDGRGRQLSSSLNSIHKPPFSSQRAPFIGHRFSDIREVHREDPHVVLCESLKEVDIIDVVAQDVEKEFLGDSKHLAENKFVVVAIDFGTTYSGYAFSFIRDPENNIHMMRKWEGGDPGLNNQKIPTTLLLSPEGEFHSFGFCARDYFHDLDPQEAKKWYYFDKFKMALHDDQDVSRSCELRAANGKAVPALRVFGLALRHLKDLVLTELSDHVGGEVVAADIRWVVTVPAIWRQPAKQFMREAAYQAGVCDAATPEGLLIALEPECASICCRNLRLNHLVPERMSQQEKSLTWPSSGNLQAADINSNDLVLANNREGLRYVVVDCGGGTVDITVHELNDQWGTLRELHRATGGPWGSVRVDFEFERLLEEIFGADFMTQFKLKRPAAFVELMLSFEARKRSASPYKDTPLNVFPPFAFIDYYRKCSGKEVEHAVKKLGRKEISWSSQGMLRLQPSVMRELFGPTITKILDHIRKVLDSPSVGNIEYLFLVGGFSESQILQHEVRTAFKDQVNVIIPQGVSLAILRGAVQFGLNPMLITTRRSKQTYGVGIMKRFDPNSHPRDKLVIKDGVEWCADLLDKFVLSEQAVELGETVVRRYTPARPSQSRIVINIYSADTDDVHFITDDGVTLCGTLTLELIEKSDVGLRKNRFEIHTRMVFGGTEISASALDVTSGQCVQIDVDFLTS